VLAAEAVLLGLVSLAVYLLYMTGNAAWVGRLGRYTKLFIYALGFLAVLLVSVPLGVVLRNVKWLNQPVRWPRRRGSEDPQGSPQAPAAGPSSRNMPPGAGMLAKVLFSLCAAPALVCAVGLAEPTTFVPAAYGLVFQVACGAGLVVSLVGGAAVYLWIGDRTGLD
jgi:hypothetical protein